MKNPWKKTENIAPNEWSGKYNKHDKKFWTDDNKQKAGLDKLKPGEFFMSVEDFKDAFKHYTIVYLHDKWHNSFIEKRNAVNKKNYRFNFTIGDEDLADVV